MSMHKIPLTKLEEDGLRAHGLDIGKPSQLSDVFRQGVAWALAATLTHVGWTNEQGDITTDPDRAKSWEKYGWKAIPLLRA